MERAGEYWKIVEVQTVTVASDPERVDVVKVFLNGPSHKHHCSGAASDFGFIALAHLSWSSWFILCNLPPGLEGAFP
jgi:hypothetical protein